MSEDEEDDWFERALRETEDEDDDPSQATATDSDEDGEEDQEPDDRTGGESGELGGVPEPTSAETDPFGGVAPDEPTDGDESKTQRDESASPGDETEWPGEEGEPAGDEGGSTDNDPETGENPGADSLGDAEGGPVGGEGPDAFGGAGQGPLGSGEQDAFGGGFDAEGETDPFGGPQFDQGGGGGTDFDEESFDSDIDRIDVGIEGLDEMILGGIPKRSLMVTIGSAGTGKTTFALQFLTEALENGEKAVYVTLEESREAILSTAEEKGWPFREWHREGQLAVVSMDPIEMANSLASIRNDISRLVEEFDADRLVLDSVSLLEMMYDHPADRRSEVFDFARSLKRAGVTTMLTSEASAENAYTSRYGIIEYLVDAAFILQYVRPSDFRETRLAVEIQKVRDANHSRETKPYEITNDGISVYRQANIF